ncbi:hypothetical protein ATCC90586_006644 [Pythium insidiosum]|nr:hypothetical protein ATCC90586_006644 [Pythium insidiosum]
MSIAGSAPASLLLVLWLLLRVHAASAAVDIKRTNGIFGAIQTLDRTTTAERLLEQCFTGFSLNGCKDRNTTRKDFAFSSQFTDATKMTQPYCLQCCTKPVPRLTGADETWNLSCPLNDLQRLSVSKGRRTFRFARRNTLQDDAIVECPMPNRTLGTYLNGYVLTVWIIERSATFGAEYWRSVVNCSATISETGVPPTTFSEVIRVRSIPTAQDRPTAWVTPTFLTVAGLLILFSVPLFRAGWRGERCAHCGSWLVFVPRMCAVCVCIGCRLTPPPPKVYALNGDPRQPPKDESQAEADDDDNETSDSDDGDDESGDEDKPKHKTPSRRKPTT